MVPHERTLRNARENVKQMVSSGVSLQRIKSYLSRWCDWWVQTAECWTRYKLLTAFLDTCWDKSVYAIAAACTKPQKIAVKETPQVTWTRKLPA